MGTKDQRARQGIEPHKNDDNRCKGAINQRKSRKAQNKGVKEQCFKPPPQYGDTNAWNKGNQWLTFIGNKGIAD